MNIKKQLIKSTESIPACPGGRQAMLPTGWQQHLSCDTADAHIYLSLSDQRQDDHSMPVLSKVLKTKTNTSNFTGNSGPHLVKLITLYPDRDKWRSGTDRCRSDYPVDGTLNLCHETLIAHEKESACSDCSVTISVIFNNCQIKQKYGYSVTFWTFSRYCAIGSNWFIFMSDQRLMAQV